MRSGAKVLILFARFGEGHWQAAQALKAAFARQGIEDVLLCDLLAEAHPMLNEVSRYIYRKSYTYWPKVYGWVYEATREMKPESLMAHFLHSFGADTLRRLIKEEQPDAVIHTFPALVLPALADRLACSIPMYNVVTDFDLHMRWVHPKVSKYYVATIDLRNQLIDAGVPRERIFATGIPLRASFGQPLLTGKQPGVVRFGLKPHLPVVLLMASACGDYTSLRRLCDRLSSKESGVQIAVVCGHNRLLHDRMLAKFEKNGNVAVFGYVEQIDELMALSTCIVTKPGGLTLSESIQAGLPIFLYRPMPGQERGNARYLAARGAAIISRTSGELSDAILQLLRSPAARQSMQLALAELRQDRSADRIVLDILQDLPIIEMNEAVHS